MAKKRKFAGTIAYRNKAGEWTHVKDHRFDNRPWPFAATVSAPLAEDWLLHINAEMDLRGWNAGGIAQLDSKGNSGSLTIHLNGEHIGRALEISWTKERNGQLEVRARPGGDLRELLEVLDSFFQAIDARLKGQQREREHRRWWLVYEGLPWTGELWLGDSLRLGPPSRFPGSLTGRQAVIVDAEIAGIGWQGIQSEFKRQLQELSLVLSPIIGVHLEVASSTYESEWVPEFDGRNRLVDCRLRSIGYSELVDTAALPLRGSSPAVTRETVSRPGLGRVGIWPDDESVRVPSDAEALWAAFNSLSPSAKQQFLNACNAYWVARHLPSSQRTACLAFLVVACEALKPPGKQYEVANIYDVVSSLIGTAEAASLKNLYLSPQKVRSLHFHRGTLVANEIMSLLIDGPFRDPSFDELLTQMSRLARMCLIEWLRRGGPQRFSLMQRPGTRKQGSKAPVRSRP